VALLQVTNLKSGYDQVQILWGIDLDVCTSETVILLGANGVGKTTILRAIIGLLPCWSGEILFEGEPVQTLKPSERIRRGIGYMSELGVFPDLSVTENIRLMAIRVVPGSCRTPREHRH